MLSGIISVAWPLVQKYAKPAIILILGLIAGAVIFHQWKSGLIEQGHDKGVAECTKERDEANTEATEAYQKAVEALVLKNNQNQKEFENALYIYANRPADVVIERVPVRVKASCPVGTAVTGGTESRSGDPKIGGQFIEAELSPGAVRSIEEITNSIQELQSKCLLIKETQQINQGG